MLYIYIFPYLPMFVLCVFFVCFWYAPNAPTVHLPHQELVEPTVQKMTVLASEAAPKRWGGRLTVDLQNGLGWPPKRVGCFRGFVGDENTSQLYGDYYRKIGNKRETYN